MSKQLTFTRPHLLDRLSDELLAAIPALRPVPGGPLGYPTAVLGIEGSGTDLRLIVPDDADVAAIEAVINAHDATPAPVPPPPDYGTDALPSEQRAAAVTQLREYLGLAAPTGANTVGALKLAIRLLLLVARRVL